MSKRGSKFPRHEDDFYPTPQAAVPPLIPYLRGIRTFAEPCVGEGALVGHLESFGLRCVYAGDIRSGQDALDHTSYGDPDAVITNPPYKRTVMHALIDHFQSIATTWLLLEMDWASTKQAVPYLAHCSHIVVVGRLRWITGTEHVGYDNFGWFCFAARHVSGPVLHPYRMPPSGSRSCAQCQGSYRPHRSDSMFCSNACRQRAYREGLAVTQA